MSVKFLPITDKKCLNYHYTIWSKYLLSDLKNNVLGTLGKLSKNYIEGTELEYVDTNFYSNPTSIAKRLSNRNLTIYDREDAFIIKSSIKYEKLIKHELKKLLGDSLKDYEISYYKTGAMNTSDSSISEDTITTDTNIPSEFSKVSSYGLFLMVTSGTLKHIVIDYLTGGCPKVCLISTNIFDIFEVCYGKLEYIWSL